MRFAAIISMAFATFSMTSAVALPNEASVNAQLEKPKKNDPLKGDLHHVKVSYCTGLKKASSHDPCKKALEACEKKKTEKEEESCQDGVKKKYHD